MNLGQLLDADRRFDLESSGNVWSLLSPNAYGRMTDHSAVQALAFLKHSTEFRGSGHDWMTWMRTVEAIRVLMRKPPFGPGYKPPSAAEAIHTIGCYPWAPPVARLIAPRNQPRPEVLAGPTAGTRPMRASCAWSASSPRNSSPGVRTTPF